MSGLRAALAALVVACGGAEGKDAAEPEDPGVTIDRGPEHRRTVSPEDDARDDGLEVTGLRGHIDSYDIQRGVEPHAQRLTDCYNRPARRSRFLGGEVHLDFRVARSGEVKSVRMARSDLGSWAAERCLLETARQMTFVRPKGGEAEFSLPLEFAATRPASWLAEDAAEPQLEPLLPELGECADESEAAAPSALTVTLYVGPRGKVKSVGFASADEAGIEPAWADCAAARIGAWTLADPMGRIAKLSFQYN